MFENRHALWGLLTAALFALFAFGAFPVAEAIFSDKEMLGFALMVLPIVGVVCLLLLDRWGGALANAVLGKPIHSWRPRFELRTLFMALTVVCIWFGYHFNWIRQRHEFLANHSEVSVLVRSHALRFGRTPVPAPLALRVFGEQGVDLIMYIHKPDRIEQERVERLFPEAIVSVAKHF